MPAVTRVKTAKVSFALTTPNRALVVTGGWVPAAAVSKIALGVPASTTVRGLTMNLPVRQRFGQRPVGQHRRDKDHENGM
jgi:hypothetical protein